MSVVPILQVEQVVKQFEGLRAVDGLSFDVRAGEVFGFLGPNGAGKTSTLRMILGITRPDSGAIRFEGRPALDRSRVGYLPEERGLFEDAPVIDMLVYLGALRGMSRRDARVSALRWLERLELADGARKKLNTLSKGNQQKVQFAGALLHRPVLAILDEPFSGLDPLNQETFIAIIRGLCEDGVAVLLSAHQLNLAERLCDRFLLIARGRRVLAGTLDSMRDQVAGGARDVLTVRMRGGSVADVEAALERAAPGAERRIESIDGAFSLEIILATGTDLNRLLTSLAGGPRIERVEMRPLPLHEIYLRAVRHEREVTIEEAGEVAGV